MKKMRLAYLHWFSRPSGARCLATLGLALAMSGSAAATELSLPDLLRMASEQNRLVLAARSGLDAARAGIRTASAYPNPEMEVLSGSSDARRPGVATGSTRSVGISQPIELPLVRSPRIAAAEAQARSVEAEVRATEAELLARVKLRYFELLKRQAEERLAKEDRDLTGLIRDRIALRVEHGEAPRFELTKADTEFLNGTKNYQAAVLRIAQARAGLRQAVGEHLPVNYAVQGELPTRAQIPALEKLYDELRQRSPDLARVRAEEERATRTLDLEKARRWPTLTFKAARDTDVELENTRAGLAVSIPLWDRRAGPIDQAAAELSRARRLTEAQEAGLLRGLESAYRLYEIAASQVSLLEENIVGRAEATLRVAEAAYRNGERGILEVLDAQRVLRAARIELVAAKYELAAAVTEIDRLRATPLLEERGYP